MDVDISGLIRKVRTDRRMTQEQLGALVGVSKAAVAQWEAEDPAKRTLPDLRTLAKLKMRLNVSWDSLLGEEFDQAYRQHPEAVAAFEADLERMRKASEEQRLAERAAWASAGRVSREALAPALELLGFALSLEMPDRTRAQLAELMGSLVRWGGAESYQRMLLDLLAAPRQGEVVAAEAANQHNVGISEKHMNMRYFNPPKPPRG